MKPSEKLPAAERLDWLPADVRDLFGRLGRGLKALYGKRYRGLVLYGSYARGEADEGSDVDLLLLLDGDVDLAQEMRAVRDVKWPLSLEAGYTVSVFPVSVEDYRESMEPMLRNVRKEGILAA